MKAPEIILRGILVGIGLTFLTYVFSTLIGGTEVNYIEVGAVALTYMCVYMCVHQTRWNYPVGIAGTAVYSLLFYTQGLYAVALFNLYLVFSQLYGWFRWRSDSDPTPITTVQPWWWTGYALAGLGIFGLLSLVNNYFGVTTPTTEILIVVASGVAQLLLDNKKIETWGVWALVNVLSILYFFSIGLNLVGFQYIFLLGNTVYGCWQWLKDIDEQYIVDDGYGDCCLHSHRCKYDDTH